MPTDRRSAPCVWLLVAGLLSVAAPASAGELLTEAGGLFSSGDYGGTERVDVWESYLRIGYSYSRVSATLTAPVVHLDGPGVPTGGGVVPVSVQEAEPFLPSGPPSPPTGETTADERDVDATGLGDVRLELRCGVLDEGAWWPAVSLVAEVKAPTADPDRGLGTGEWDAGGGLILAKRFDRLQLQLDARALAIGEPPDVELEPVVFSGQLTVGWSIWLDVDVTLTPFVFASAQTRTSREVDAPVEAGAGAWLGLGRWVVGLSAAAGLTDGSPDLAVGFSLSLVWPEVGPAE